MRVKMTSSSSYQPNPSFIAHYPKQVLRTLIEGTSDVEVKKIKQSGIPGGQWRLFWFLLTLTTLWAANEDTDCLQGTKDIDLNILPPSYGYRLVVDTLADTNSVSSTGDVNGDGINDVLVGSHTGDPDLNRQNAGITYVLFGQNASCGLRDNLDMNSLNPATGFRILGKEAGDQSGFAVASGDLNGDLINDIIIGARYATVAAKLKVGIVYVLYGSAVVRSASTNDVDLALFSTSAGTGFRIMGKSQDDNVGSALATGDVNNDGKTDIIVGAPTSGSANVGRASAGITVVVYGHTGPTVDVDLSISLVTSSAGYRIYGYVPSGISGSALCVCDVNGDNINDVVIGAPDASTEVRNVAGGVVYVVYGTAHAADVDLQTLDGNSHHGYRIVGAVLNDRAGTSVACGDVNGNGMPDVIIGATGADPLQRSNSGAVYVVYGHNTTSSSVNTTDKDLFSMGTSNAFGYQIYGTINGDTTGVSVASGDVNADGIQDVVIGATSVFPSSLRAYSGMVYVVYGHSYNTYDTTDVDLAQLVSGDSTGYRIAGIGNNNYLGTAVSVGDVNNDGIADVVAGANQPTSYTGLASIVYGYNRSAVCVANASADIDLKYLTTDTGYIIVGKIDRTGQSVCTGDVNGDGISDVITGAVYGDVGGSAAGIVYVVFGRTIGSTVIVATMTSSIGITIYGDTGGDNTGNSVSTGDINNDGISDIIFAAFSAAVSVNGSVRTAAGVVYVVFGRTNLQDVYLYDWDGSEGFKILGAGAIDQTGSAVASADVNGDGICDVIITAPLADPLGRSNAGSVYVVYGINSSTMSGGAYPEVDLLTFHTDSSAGFRIIGANIDYNTGVHVASSDINGDGIYDIIIGSSAANVVNRGKTGMVYVIYGKHNHTNIDLLHINNRIGFRVLGVSNDDRTGMSVGSGDVNGDGVHDLILSAYWADPDVTRINAGTVYVLFGHNSSHDTSYITNYGMYHNTHNTTDIDLSDFNTSDVTGFRIFGGAYNDNIGRRIASGDVNDDGYSDVIIGSIGASSLHSVDNGITYVVYGSASVADIDLQYTLPRTTGYRILGVAVDDQSGYSVSTGDVNNDGVCDVITSAPLAHVGTKLNVGAAYVVYGVSIYGDPTSQPSTQPSSQPSMQPSGQPVTRPTSHPSTQPSTQPSMQPSMQPSTQPTTQPSRLPTVQPSARPSSQPTSQPSVQPMTLPSSQPSMQPSAQPTVQPSVQPSTQPSSVPSLQPTVGPTAAPTSLPSAQPTEQPSRRPSSQPSTQPSSRPSVQPSSEPSVQPSCRPSARPSVQPSNVPSNQPSAVPSIQSSAQPTHRPSRQPSCQPSSRPSTQPSSVPSSQPSSQPSGRPSASPTLQPSEKPSTQPSSQPSIHPSACPTTQPSEQPSSQPSLHPSAQPTQQPLALPTAQPSVQPSTQPSAAPTVAPSSAPSGEWATMHSGGMSVRTVAQVADFVWSCGERMSSNEAECILMSKDTGEIITQYAFGWDRTVSAFTTSVGAVMLAGWRVSAFSTTSEVAKCDMIEGQLQCAVKSFADTQFLAATYVPYPNRIVTVGMYNVYVSATITDMLSDTVRSFIYTLFNMKSVVLSQVQSPPNFIGSFVAGTAVRSAGSPVKSIIAGMLRTDNGVLSALCLVPVEGDILNSADLVTSTALEITGPDLFIAGGLQLSDGAGANAYILRTNALYGTVTYCVRFRLMPQVNEEHRKLLGSVASRTVARGVIIINNNLFVILDHTRTNVTHLTAVKLNAATGAIVQQVHISANNASLLCTDMAVAGLFLTLVCNVYPAISNTSYSVTIAFNTNLGFESLPAGFHRSDSAVLTTEAVSFQRSIVAVTALATSIAYSSSEFNTADKAPSRRPSAAPSSQPSTQPSSAPSTQPSSSPTAAPTVSARPTSQPSTASPTNTHKPSAAPTVAPTTVPTAAATAPPSTKPTVSPSASPSVKPSALPSTAPTVPPTARPTSIPAASPSRAPRSSPSVPPARAPSASPTVAPTFESNNGSRSRSTVIWASVGGALLLCACGYTLYKYKMYIVEEDARAKRKVEFFAHQEKLVAALEKEREEMIQQIRLEDARKEKNRMKQRAKALARMGGAHASGRARPPSPLHLPSYPVHTSSPDSDPSPVRSLSPTQRSRSSSPSRSRSSSGESSSHSSSFNISSLHSSELSSKMSSQRF